MADLQLLSCFIKITMLASKLRAYVNWSPHEKLLLTGDLTTKDAVLRVRE
jgi:hypothetical protein